MSHGFAVVIGMTVAYIASFAGMIFAYLYYKKHKGTKPENKNPEPEVKVRRRGRPRKVKV